MNMINMSLGKINCNHIPVNDDSILKYMQATADEKYLMYALCLNKKKKSACFA